MRSRWSATFRDTWSPRIAGVESVADVTQIPASQFLRRFLPLMLPSLKQGESLQLRLCLRMCWMFWRQIWRSCLRQQGSWRQERFAILDPIEGDNQKRIGSTVGDGDVEVFPLTDDAREEVPRPLYRRLVLVPRETHRSVQDSSRHGQFTASESGEDSFLPVPGQMDDEGDVDEPLCFVVGESDTESLNGGASSASGTEEVPAIPEPGMAFEDVRLNSCEIRDSFVSLDAVDLIVVFSRRVVLMKTVPHFLRGAFRNAMRIAMEEATHAQAGRHERGWKLLMLLPRMLLHRPEGREHPDKLVSRFDDFSAGRWDVLIRASEVVTGRQLLFAHGSDDISEVRMMSRCASFRWFRWVNSPVGGSGIPGNDRTLAMLQDPSKRPPRIRLGDELPTCVPEFAPEISFELDEKKFLTNLRTSRSGAAAGPSRLVLDTVAQLLFKLGEQLSRAETPTILNSVRLGRLTGYGRPWPIQFGPIHF